MWPQPPGETQYSSVTDFYSCVSEAMVHCIESQEIAQTGKTIGYSERALAKLSATDYTNPIIGQRGNTVGNVVKAIQTYGLIPDSLWPSQPTSGMTAEEYYQDIPSDILSQAIKFDVELINGGGNLTLSPLLVNFNNGEGHLVEGLSTTQYFDSEATPGNYLKNYQPTDHIVWTGNLILNPKSKRMLVFFQVKGLTTIWALQDGQWVGFSDPTAFNNYVAGRPNAVIQLDQTEFAKVQANPDVYKH